MSEEGRDDCARIEREAYDWVRRFSTRDGRPADLEALKQWSARSPAHREAFERVSRTWQGLGTVGKAFPQRDEAPVARPPLHVDRRIFLGLGGALAASAAAIGLIADPPLGLWSSWSELSADYSTRPGERLNITLANKVAIELNTRTSITLRRVNGQSNGIELLSGEAMIATPKMLAPVTIVAGHGRIMATDARFNVRCLNQVVSVSCLVGQVQVEQGRTVLPLQAGRQVTYSDQGIGSAAGVDLAAVTAWQNDLVVFRATPITEVIAEVNRYRPGKVILTNTALGNRRLNARFRIEDMDKVIGQIEQIFGAHATMLPYGIVLLG